MPFSTRVVPPRPQIPDIYGGHAAQNILEKNSVSNMVGLLHQLNVVSKYASEVFGDIFAATEKNHQRIVNVKNRLSNIEQRVPKQESLFHINSPMFFYDNPYMGSEFQRKDPNQGLLFRRDRCPNEVNRRRTQAEPVPDFSSLDKFSPDGQPNSVKYTDARFFINEWLAAEERKIKEEKKKRKAEREARRARREKSGKSGKIKRQQTQVLRVKVKKFDKLTGQAIADDDQDQYTSKQDLKLTDNNSPVTTSPKHSSKRTSKKVAPYTSPQMKSKQQALSTQQQQQDMSAIGKSGKPGPPPGPRSPPNGPRGVGASPPNGPGGPPPPPIAAKEPTPPNAAYGVQGAGAPVVVPNGGHPPPPPNIAGGQVQQQQYMGAPPHVRSAPSYGGGGQIEKTDTDVSISAPARPAFMQQLIGDNVQARLKPTPKVARKKPMDSRSAMLTQLQGNKAKHKLKRVDTEAIAAAKAAEQKDESHLVSELLKRRAYLDSDDDGDDTDSDWDSD